MKSKGVSLIELLIIMGVLAALAGLFFIGYSGAKKRIDIDNASNSIVTKLMELRLKSMTTDKLHGFMTSNGCMSGRDCYASFVFDDQNNNYIIDDGEIKDIYYINFPPYLRFVYVSGNSETLFFDKRGFPRDEQGNFFEKTLKLQLWQGGKKLEREIVISTRIFIRKP